MSNSGSIKIGLEALGLQDNQHLKNALINCEDPLKAISEFQEENSILLPTLKPALNLLDLHGIKRIDFHVSIAEELKETLIKRVDELSKSINSNAKEPPPTYEEDLKKLEDLLDKSFPLINIPRLTQLVMTIMKSLPKINDMYLNYIKDNENLYNLGSIEVKRQIWSAHKEVFVKELQPILDKATNYFEEILCNFEQPLTNMSSTTTATQPQINIDVTVVRESLLLTSTAYVSILKLNKRLGAYLGEVIKLIGNSNRLYQFTVSHLTNLYVKTQNWFYSTLRSQLLVKFNESFNHDSVGLIVSGGDTQSENVHKFTAIINMCLREKKIDTKKAKELEAIIESKKFEKIITDAAFILGDPFVIDMLARNALSFLNRSVQNELLPRNCTELIFVLRLLSLSLSSWDMINTQATKEAKIDSVLITDYLPNIAYFITDYYEKLYDDSLESLSTTSTTQSLLTTSPNILAPSQPLNNNPATSSTKIGPPIVLKISTRKHEIVSAMRAQMSTNEICSVLYLYLILACFELNDWTNLKVLLPGVKFPERNFTFFIKWFLYQLFNILVEKSTIEQFKQDWFVSLVFDEFLLVLIQQHETVASQQQQQPLTTNSNIIYDFAYKIIEKTYPAQLSQMNFVRLIESVKPKKIVILFFKLP